MLDRSDGVQHKSLRLTHVAEGLFKGKGTFSLPPQMSGSHTGALPCSTVAHHGSSVQTLQGLGIATGPALSPQHALTSAAGAPAANLPDPQSACLGAVQKGTPEWDRIAGEAARTVPGRENGGTQLCAMHTMCVLIEMEQLMRAWCKKQAAG